MPNHPPVHFRAAGVSLVLDVQGPVPSVVHWGADLGDLDPAGLRALVSTASVEVPNNAPDVPRRLTLLPTERDMWSGTPGLSGHLGGRRTSPRPLLVDEGLRVTHDADTGSTLEAALSDAVTGLEIGLLVRLTPQGLVLVRHRVRRPEGDPDAEQPYDLSAVTALLPLPPRASEILDFTGKWARERQPQRLPVVDGAHHRHLRRGKPGPDSPYLTLAGTPSFNNRTGEVWAFHLAWSGESHWRVERLPEGAGASTSVAPDRLDACLTPAPTPLLPAPPRSKSCDRSSVRPMPTSTRDSSRRSRPSSTTGVVPS